MWVNPSAQQVDKEDDHDAIDDEYYLDPTNDIYENINREDTESVSSETPVKKFRKPRHDAAQHFSGGFVASVPPSLTKRSDSCSSSYFYPRITDPSAHTPQRRRAYFVEDTNFTPPKKFLSKAVQNRFEAISYLSSSTAANHERN